MQKVSKKEVEKNKKIEVSGFHSLIGKLPQAPKEVSTIPEMGFFYRETATSHEYYYDKKRLTGVTTALNSIAKDSLITWALRLAKEYLLKLISGKKQITAEDVENATNEHTLKKNQAADIGSTVHEACEEYVKNNKLPNFQKGTMEQKCFDNFYSWWNSSPKKLISSEQRLYNLQYWYAGTCDLIYEEDGKIWVGDIKTSSARYDRKSNSHQLWDRSYHAQTAAYQYAFQEMTGKSVYGRKIIRVGKDGTFSTHDSFAFEQDFSVFLAALTIHRFNKN